MARVALQSLADGVVVNAANQFSAGATVHVYTTGTTTAVPVYSDGTSSTVLSQPLTTDSVGRIPGFVDGQQTLDVVVTVGGSTFPAAQTDAIRGDQTPSLDGSGRLVVDQLPAHASSHSSTGSDPITPASIGAATVGSVAATLQVANNLLDVASVSTARTNLGLGTAATHATGDFLQTANLLADLTDMDAARGNLGVPMLRSAQTAATTNISSLTGLSAIAGYTPSDGDRVLLTAQTTASQNGPYIVHSGAWTRPTDYPTGQTYRARLIQINGGANAGLWGTSSTALVTVDTTSTTWVNVTSGGATAGVTSFSGRTGAVAPTHGDYSYKFRSVHTWALQGPLAVASGTSDAAYIPPFFVSVGANETVQLVKVRGVIGGGTSVACTLQKNGTNITGFSTLTITGTASSTTPTAVSVVEDDQINLILSSLAGTPANLTLTVVLEHTVT